MNPRPGTSLRQALREATKEPHRELDHHPLMAALLRPQVTLGDYADALAALHGAYAAAEAGILAFLALRPGLFDYAGRLKLPALESDLAMLGRVPVSHRAPLDVPHSLGELIGVLYTIEGSTLGGQVIARQLAENLGVGIPLSFYRCYGDAVLPRWQAFLEFAEAACPESELDLALAGAVSCFEAFRRQLDDCQSCMTAA